MDSLHGENGVVKSDGLVRLLYHGCDDKRTSEERASPGTGYGIPAREDDQERCGERASVEDFRLQQRKERNPSDVFDSRSQGLFSSNASRPVQQR